MPQSRSVAAAKSAAANPGSSADRPVTELSSVTQDYLKVIWTSQEWADVKVTTKMLAEKLRVSASTASEAIKKLADQGLVSHERYGSVTLTEEGRTAAILMVRRHRLLETFLVRELGYGWDEVHDEAEILEHAVSDRLMSRLDAKLGYPARDPHGDPIPALDGSVSSPQVTLLADLDVRQTGRVARISDTDPDMLRYFAEVGLALDCEIAVVEKRPFAGTISVSVDGNSHLDLGDVAARAIFVMVP